MAGAFNLLHLAFKYIFVIGLYSSAFTLMNFAYQGYMDWPSDLLRLGNPSQYCVNGKLMRVNQSCVDFSAYQLVIKKWANVHEATARNRQTADRFLRAMVKQDHPQAYADLSACVLSQLCSDDGIGQRSLKAGALLDEGLAKHPDNTYLKDQYDRFHGDTSLIVSLWFTRIQKKIDTAVDAIEIPGISSDTSRS
jgi:hypothetical protein